MSVAVHGCDPAIADDIARIATIELHAVRVDGPNDVDGPDVTRVDVTCEENETVSLRVVDPLTSKAVTRVVSIAGVDARARARTIALAVAELAFASWVELETTPTPVVQPVPPRVQNVVPEMPRPIAHVVAPPLLRARAAMHITPPPSSPSPPSSALPVVFESFAVARVFFGSGEPLFGAGIAVEPWFGLHVLMHFDAFVEYGTGSREPGDVSVTTASTAVGIGVGTASRMVRIAATFDLRAGYGRIGGSSTQSFSGQTISDAWFGPEIMFALELLPHAHVHPVASLGVGWAVVGVDAEVPGDRDVLVRGAWGTFAIGIAAN